MKLPQPSQLTRRKFVASATTVAATAGVWSELPAQESNSPNEKINLICVGTANRAAADVDGVKSQNIIAFCDVDSRYLDVALSKHKDARGYADYREMIDTESSKADGIVVATADHNHAPATMRAINAGLHCYCEKPLTHTVQEARMIAEAAKKKGVVTQMGTQIHAGDNYRRVVEIIRSGAIGDVTDVHVWVGKVWGGGELPEKGETPPANLNWDLWLGPAPVRPYAAGRYHPASWRRWWAFGQGTLGDMGCHYMDLPFWALDLRHPTSCEAEGPEVHPETCPEGLIVKYQFPQRQGHVGQLPPVSLTWYDGKKVPREVAGEKVPNSGVMFVGSKGHLFSTYGSYKLFPRDKFSNFQAPEQSIPNSIGHHAEWIKACKDGSPTTCNFDYSGALTETVLLGNVAYRVGKKIQWDAKTLTSPNCPEAAQYISKEYRAGWEVNPAV
ncbi:Gfo/Idh/MocA family protein [Planctomycetes bacterium K23_9]|uniref:Inositol 2-dehydrogenase n=1 Tax=Stieleria marina TaxID=1930275 RepID=A0A517NWK9_9BACT|nr:Inositol 2-dehydrogenase [Planctomycetes bacterium K23_9]